MSIKLVAPIKQVGAKDAVIYNPQELTDEQKSQARTNIGAISSSDLVQADWNQNDTTAKDYIKNRICYEETGEDKTYTLTPNRDNDTWNFTNGDIPLTLGQSATVKSFGGNSLTFVGTVTQDSDGRLCIDATSVIPITIYSNTATYYYSWISNSGIDYVTVTISSTVVHQIDPKFIPTVSPDWNQNDETAKDYIKNRICYTEESITEFGTSYEIWKELIGSTTEIADVPLSIKYDGIVYKNIKPWYMDQHYYYDLDSSVGSMIIVLYTGAGSTGNITAYPEKEWSFVQVNDPIIHQIPSEYINTTDIIDTTMNEGVVPFVVQNFVAYITPQALTDNQKQIARNNIGAISSSELVQSDWNQNDTSASDYIKNKPTIDTALSSTSENAVQNKVVKTAIDELQNAVEEYIGSKVSDKELILFSSTENSTKKFKITVNDSGTISAKEVTENA